MQTSSSAAPIRVWDAAVRLTHWSVAALVLWDLVESSGGPLHRTLGYTAAGLVLFRLFWGIVGSRPARFSTWMPSPANVFTYTKALLAGRAPRYLSHTPLGALMMVALWALILALAATGWISRLDSLWGEDWPLDLHGLLAHTLLVLVIIHVIAALAMSAVHRENLIAAMLTARKRPPDAP